MVLVSILRRLAFFSTGAFCTIALHRWRQTIVTTLPHCFCKYTVPGLIVAPWAMYLLMQPSTTLSEMAHCSDMACLLPLSYLMMGHLFVDLIVNWQQLPLAVHHTMTIVALLAYDSLSHTLSQNEPMVDPVERDNCLYVAHVILHLFASDVYPLAWAVRKHCMPASALRARRALALCILLIMGTHRIPVVFLAVKKLMLMGVWGHSAYFFYGLMLPVHLFIDVMWYDNMVWTFGRENDLAVQLSNKKIVFAAPPP